MFLDLFELICYLWPFLMVLSPFDSAVLAKLVQISHFGLARTGSTSSYLKLASFKILEDSYIPSGGRHDLV